MISPEESRIWYYASAENERIGPVTVAELADLAGRGKLTPDTLVWNPQYPEWIPASKIRDLLSAAIRSEPPVTPSDEEIAEVPSRELKPRRASFLFPKIVGTLVTSMILGALASFILLSFGKSPVPGLFILVLILALGLASALAAYRKERYELKPYRLICHRGGLFSDEATEIEVRNITHVKVKLPWLRYKLFRVGNVIVETAGSAKPMVMRTIREPETMYAEMRDRMKSNGYDLSQRELIHEESPALIGVIVECVGLLFVAGFFCIFTLANFLADAETSFEGLIMRWGVGAGLLAIVTFIVLRFLDLRRRTYRVFNDVVVYEEGFLTRENAFIPYENIADSNTKRTFVDQILGLYDVLISCQGSSSEIKFRRLANGIALSAAIDHLVTSASKKPKLQKKSEKNSTNPSAKRTSRTEPEIVPDSSIRMAEYRIHAVRLLVPQLLLFPLFPIWVLAMVKSLVTLSSTRYFVRPGSLRHSYKFLRVDDREFSYDKITGVVIRRNLWDKMFGTMTLKFWSIGSGKALEFAHVHSGQIDLPSLMRQVGIPAASEETYDVAARFALVTWLRARSWAALALLVISGTIVTSAILAEEPMLNLLLAVTILVATVGLIHAILYFPRQQLRFHEHHVEAEQGVIAKSQYFVRYKNIKRVTATSYPGGKEGDLKIYVAGEEEVSGQQAQRKGRKQMLKQCSFTSGMLTRPGETARLLDDILAGRIEQSPDATPATPSEILVESKRSTGNALLVLLLISILLFPLIVLLPITIPLTILRVKRWSYRIEDFRIVRNHGVLFRKETSVLLDRVDSLQQSQGLLNKMFRNGKVSIMTAGSSKPDLVLIDSPDFRKLHDTIREYSE